ncbi:hypothetical protein HMPREF9998_01755 [Peptostreptococcus anaerobius VPI 4330 = DSM 2949]|nr:hypothetical protein HMPREF9998_01755 [Peptostreptococcus anaerobius VPI 4330 = DSM 2949]
MIDADFEDVPKEDLKEKETIQKDDGQVMFDGFDNLEDDPVVPF